MVQRNKKPIKVTDLRVISGKYRGRKIAAPDSILTHPMGSREKLALFNLVAVDGLVVLDAYAGSGALGIEALSRGAKEVVFVDASVKSTRTIRANLESLPAAGEIIMSRLDKFAQGREYQRHFDVILADPPYDGIDVRELQLLAELLKDNGVLALSSPAAAEPPVLVGLRISSTHTYARARITIYKK